MATLGDLITDLRNYTDRTSAIITDAIGTGFVNTAIDRMQEASAWQGQETISADLPYTSTDNGISVPTGFIYETSVWLKDTVTVDPSRALSPIDRITRAMWFERLTPRRDPNDAIYPASSDADFPDRGDRYYFLWGQKLYYVPNPSTTTQLVIDFYKRLDALSSGALGGSNFFTLTYAHVVRWGALAECWAFLHEDDRAKFADDRFKMLLIDGSKNDQYIKAGGGARARGA
jgi:hypothetical protein